MKVKIDRYFRKYEEVTPAVVKDAGVKLLLCDLDYTLVPRWVRQPTIKCAKWIKTLQKHGITVVIISNNRSKRRVQKFINMLSTGSSQQILAYHHTQKPCPIRIWAIIKHLGFQRRETALLGDRLHTDMQAANKAHIRAWKVPHRILI